MKYLALIFILLFPVIHAEEADVDIEKLSADKKGISERFLINRFQEILNTRNSCRVKLLNDQIIKLTSPVNYNPLAAKDNELLPMVITIDKFLTINKKPHQEQLNASALDDRLESYSSATRAAGRIPTILLRIGPSAKDKTFQETLQAISKHKIKLLLLTEHPKLSP